MFDIASMISNLPHRLHRQQYLHSPSPVLPCNDIGVDVGEVDIIDFKMLGPRAFQEWLRMKKTIVFNLVGNDETAQCF